MRNQGISDASRQRVLDAARELSYEPNAAARVLAGGITGTIAQRDPQLLAAPDAGASELIIRSPCGAHRRRV